MAQGCCGCCSALRPRYKRLVDNIFPASPQDGLVKSNMEKLTFYSLSSPEKLDRIGEYLFVIIAMEAMDQLLVACHSQTLNLFVESFLKMFVRFANIEEDTPSYHRRYDFFVSKFSAMCHSNHSDKTARDKIRLAGIQGLQGVIRKTVSDDLVENIWEAQHMDKIVPSLLYNMQSAEKYETLSCMDTDGRDGMEDDPPRLAEACLRELVGRASFGHIRSVLRPVLTASVARDSEKETDEKLYQEALINALGEFADHLPDFQKIDIMMFILESNTLENIEAIYTTLALLVIELGSEETVCDFMQLILAVCVALGLLLPRTRAHDYLLKMALCECLKASGLDPSRLQAPSPYAAGSHPAQVESVSLEALRRAAGGPSEAERREAERRRATLNSAFRTAPFDHLLHLTQPELSGGRAPPAALGVLAFRFAPESRAAALQVLPGAVPLLGNK
ncbi:hypothetical protein MSG28_013879 [Choristoneura fumiferana]|uniref:Uncharacterized protein n=2 Tax=Choristoneura fumiferana TaxID=7141 RepID=A0ACC0K9E3_CHOFU|nr:hypothetical protein MSG28_013879 [Choristoneura fumiferana]